jgi:hypothetical protein
MLDGNARRGGAWRAWRAGLSQHGYLSLHDAGRTCAQLVHVFNRHACALAGSVSGILAAVLAAVAFTAMKFVSKTEPTVVLAMWYHTSAVAMSAVPLAVRPIPALQGHACEHRGLVTASSRCPFWALMDDPA